MEQKQKRLFNPTISVTNIITVLILALSGIGTIGVLNNNISINSEKIRIQEKTITRQDSQLAEVRAIQREDIREMRNDIKGMGEKINELILALSYNKGGK